jgi:hypothetical protein
LTASQLHHSLSSPLPLPYSSKLLKNDAAHGLTVSPPNRDKLTMRSKQLKPLHLIFSVSKDGAKISMIFQQPAGAYTRT